MIHSYEYILFFYDKSVSMQNAGLMQIRYNPHRINNSVLFSAIMTIMSYEKVLIQNYQNCDTLYECPFIYIL